MFSKKSIRILIQKTEGEFKEGVNTIEFKDLPVEARINRTGSMSESIIKIYGISKEHVSAITLLPNLGITQEKKLQVAVYVNDGLGEFLLYVGVIRDACPEYSQAPDICIDIHCYTLAFQNLMGSIPPTSFTGEARVPELYAAICASYNTPFIDRTVRESPMIKPPFLGQKSMKGRLDELKYAYRDIVWKEYNDAIYIYNVGAEAVKYLFTPEDFIGYPKFNQYGIGLVFDKIVGFKPLEALEISGSEIDSINRKWSVVSCYYNLSTKIGGKWNMDLTCMKME